MKKWLIFAFCISIIGNIDATIIHVPGDYPTIQEGIDSANVGDTVLVAPGVYDTTSGEVFPINMRNGVYLLSETGPEETIIDGRNLQELNIITCENLIDTVRIEGFTICNGGGWGSLVSTLGGGIYAESSNIIIKNNILRDNIAYGWGQYDDAGGGIYISGGYALIENNIITGNKVVGEYTKNNTFISKGMPMGKGEGGVGIYCENAKVIIKNNVIEGNVAWGSASPFFGPLYGGGISCTECSSAVIFNNIIDNNHAYTEGDADGGAGIYCTPSARIINNTIVYNKIICYIDTPFVGKGGGIYCDNGSVVDSIIIRDNITVFNFADTGGGIFCSDSLDLSKVLIEYNDFYRNMYNEFFNVPYGVGDFSWEDSNRVGIPCDSFYNINRDPWFVMGPNGNYYQKNVVDCGDTIVGQQFQGMGNTPDGKPDTEWVDLGYHYKATVGIDEKSFPTYSQTPLIECYPNPFISRLTIKFNLPATSNINLSIYDIAGREVVNLIDGFSASHSVVWEAHKASPGVYFIRLDTKYFVISQKVTLFRK